MNFQTAVWTKLTRFLSTVERGVDKTRNMEYPGTFRNIPEHPATSRNIPEHEKIKIFFYEKLIN